jgi:hypothetical protein
MGKPPKHSDIASISHREPHLDMTVAHVFMDIQKSLM